MAEPLLPWGHLGVTELSIEYDPDLRSYIMVTLPAFSNKVRRGRFEIICVTYI